MAKFYVYHLKDPRTCETFYVGKGTGKRMYQHEREAVRGVYSRKCDRIRSILGDGLSVYFDVVERFDDEAEAYAFEVAEIARIGLDNLTNVLPGGNGAYQKVCTGWTPSMVAKLAPKLARALKEMSKFGNLWVCDMEVTQHVRDLVSQIKKDIGADELHRLLMPHGVAIE